MRVGSPSLQSLKRGKPTEIEYLNGYIVNAGNRLDVPLPVNTITVSATRETEFNERAITINNFYDPFFERFN